MLGVSVAIGKRVETLLGVLALFADHFHRLLVLLHAELLLLGPTAQVLLRTQLLGVLRGGRHVAACLLQLVHVSCTRRMVELLQVRRMQAEVILIIIVAA